MHEDLTSQPDDSKHRTGWDRRERDDRRHIHRRGVDEPVSEERRSGTERRDESRRGKRSRRSGKERRAIPDRRSSAWKALDGELDS